MKWRDKEVNTSGRYARVWWPEHPEATRSGLLAIHRAIGFDLLGRKLVAGEVVRCVDGNLLNFGPTNWEVRRHGLSTSERCGQCGSDQNLVIKNGLSIPLCKSCRNRYARERYVKKKHIINERTRVKRRTDRAATILSDARKADRKKGFEVAQDYVDYGIIEQLIKLPCTYCGETAIQMTLDRIDNTLGHTKSNVLPACIRCNLMRRSMPYEAWLVVVESVKKARELNLFGAWTGQIHR
jgi:hypothetical protein